MADQQGQAAKISAVKGGKGVASVPAEAAGPGSLAKTRHATKARKAPADISLRNGSR